MIRRSAHLVAILALASFAGACDDGDGTAAPAVATSYVDGPVRAGVEHEHDGDSMHRIVALQSPQAVADAFVDGVARFERDEAFEQLGFMWDDAGDGALEARVRGADGQWSDWQPIEVTWREGIVHVGRLVLDAPTTAVELTGADGVAFAAIEFYPDVVARLDEPRAIDLPFTDGADDFVAHADARRAVGDLRQVDLAVDAPGWVTSRSGWGARNAGTICGSRHNPRWVTIHHTVTPTPDSVSAPQRMRGIQAYHIDSNGWCDIGYHFVVGHDGTVYQGRASHEYTGAHVGGHNTDNVGVSYMGDFTSVTPSTAMYEAGGRIVGWLTSTYGIPLDRSRVRGHREWGSTACPGNSLYPTLQRILDLAGGGDVEPEPEPEWDVQIDVRVSGTTDRLTQGTSAGLGDLLPGDEFEAEIRLTNASTDPLRDVELMYLIESPWLRATNWRIESDHPADDRATWTINSADGEAANPPRDGLGRNGTLVMHAFSPGETKRVVISLVADEDSLGAVDHPDIRGWLRRASGVYGPQDAWDATPGVNEVGRVVRDYAQTDVLGPAGWFFDGQTAEDLEGWSACNPSEVDELRLNVGDGMMAAHVAGSDSCLASPDWTSIDASRFDELVVELRSHDGPHEVAVYWAAPGAGFGADRVARFELPGDSTARTVVVPVGQTGAWGGVVGRLRLDPLDDRGPILGDSNWYDVGRVFAQSSTSRTTSAPRADYVDGPRVTLIGGTGVGPDPDAGGGSDAGGGFDAGGGGSDAGGGFDAGGGSDAGPRPDTGSGGGTITPGDAGTGGSGTGGSGTGGGTNNGGTGGGSRVPAANVEVNSPACAAGSGAPVPSALVLALLGLITTRRRR